MNDPITGPGGHEERGKKPESPKEDATQHGHKTKTTSYRVGFFVEKVETETVTPPDYPPPEPPK